MDALPTFNILSVSHDPFLSSTREGLLQSVGYVVKSTLSTLDAIELFRSGHFDLVMIGHTVPEQERKQLISTIRDHNSSTPIIYISSFIRSDHEPLADVTSGSKPDELLRNTQRALKISRTQQ